MRYWVDVPQGYLYDFPKIYDSDKDGAVKDWLADQQYEGSIDWIRMWNAEHDRPVND